MQTDATIPTMLEECANVSNIAALRSCYHGTKDTLGVVGSKVLPTKRNNKKHAIGCANRRNM